MSSESENKPWRARRFSLRVETLTLIFSIAFTLTSNSVFWRTLLTGRDASEMSTWFVAAAMFVSITCAHFLLLLLVCSRWTVKPILSVLLVANAFAVYFVEEYTVYLDPSMLRNILRTDVAEASDLLGAGMLPSLFLYALVPLFLLWRVDIIKTTIGRAVLFRAISLGLAVLIGAGAVMVQFQDIAATMRNQKAMRYLITPANFIYSGVRVLTSEAEMASQPLMSVGADAKQSSLGQQSRRPRLVVLVVGETARAANWGLSGYSRQTTPELAKLDVVNFVETISCGTNTEVSVPCMFAAVGRRDYDETRIRRSESLLHVLKHAGVRSVWIDNQSGCKGVCTGLEFVRAGSVENSPYFARLCPDGLCFDEIMLSDLKPLIDAEKSDLLVVLHQMGNHGPAYYKRYPPGFEQFKPACQRAELGECTQQEIVNAYDNALTYTDHMLAATIRLLETQTTHDVAMIYVSDHGESLGENNLYLHGVPYSIAPRTQIHVPMVMWLSPGFAQSSRISVDCLRERAKLPSSHDNLFHTTLGLMDVRTSVYEPGLNLAAGCIQ